MLCRARFLASRPHLRSALLLRCSPAAAAVSSSCRLTLPSRWRLSSPRLLSSASEAASSESANAAPAQHAEEATAHITGARQSQSFEAETKQLLDIVAHSLYTDKEVFLRELVSNASDALEKCRYLQSTNQAPGDDDTPLRISIESDTDAATITLCDSGVGMTRDELVTNLGTIARSGSQEFLKKMQLGADSAAGNIIGKFGVGFYSSFMVADRVDVWTKSAVDGSAHFWSSDGCGTFEIAEADGVCRGTKIVLHLKQDCKNFAKIHELERLVKKHSSFVGFPIVLNGETHESVGALWLQDKNSISEQQHTDFYKHIAHAYEAPRAHLHFTADAPLAIHALLYVPRQHQEKFGLGREEPGVHLYSRKVLIQPNNKHILPRWMRFVKGVVDSPDIPLNISRESMQDSALVRKINNVLARRVIRFLKEQAKHDRDSYHHFFKEFGHFLLEGVVSDATNKDAIAPLLRFESSAGDAGTLTSLDEYISRMPPTQKSIYYMCVPNRALAQSSPYFEAFKAKGTEVLFLYREVDEFVMQSLRNYEKRVLKNVQQGDVDASDVSSAEQHEAQQQHDAQQPLSPVQQTAKVQLPKFFEEVLGKKVSSVKPSERVFSGPALVVDTESASVRRMMKMFENANGSSEVLQQKMEINIRHPIIVGLNQLRHCDRALAEQIVEQVFDQALVAAGILDDPRSMVGRVNSLMEKLVKLETQQLPSDNDMKE